MRKLLLPLSLLFFIVVLIRNKLYDFGFIKISRLKAKVISVGNISAGGTGKTPFAELITRYIISKNRFTAIVIKGYMREADDMKVAEFGYGNEQGKLTSENFSDEGMLLLENLREINGRGIIVVGDDKSKAAKFADSKFQPDVIVIDDGFQHRKIHRDLDIVILNDKKDVLIPAGSLREPRHNITRADIIAINNKFDDDIAVYGTKHKPRISCKYELEGFFNLQNEKLNTENSSAVVFCGIGDPESFRQLLNVISIKISSFIKFPDHHFFSINDIWKIFSEYTAHKPGYIITTQKDFTRIKDSEVVLRAESSNIFKELLTNYPIYYAKIKMQISQNEKILFDKIDDLIN